MSKKAYKPPTMLTLSKEPSGAKIGVVAVAVAVAVGAGAAAIGIGIGWAWAWLWSVEQQIK